MTKPESLVGKAVWLIRHRPLSFLSTLRGYALFKMTHCLGSIFGVGGSNIHLGENVRLQKLGCLHAEKPGSKIIVGDHSIVYEKADIGAYGKATIELGECAVLGDLKIASRYGVKIGARFISSWNVFIQDFDPHPADPALRAKQIESICASFRPQYSKPPFTGSFSWEFPGQAITIGDDVWIGANATILKGARIGNGCIVATGAVVLAGDYPDRSLIAGNPAKVVKTL